MDVQVVIQHWGEPSMLWGALESIRKLVPELDVFVLDGRFATFGNDDDPVLTPGSKEVCDEFGQAEYLAPPEERLPFGHERPEGRYPQFEKARWTWYEAVNEERWSLRVDDDERLLKLDLPETGDELDDLRKYRVTIEMPNGDTPQLPRLWVPKYWTFFTGDLCVPRELFNRDRDVEDFQEHLHPDKTWVGVDNSLQDRIRLRNVGDERSDAYREKRETQKNEHLPSHTSG